MIHLARPVGGNPIPADTRDTGDDRTAVPAPVPAVPVDLSTLPYEVRVVAERLAQIGAAAQWDLPAAHGVPLTGFALRDWLQRKEASAAQNLAERGVGYWLLKRELGHGAFEGYLQENGVATRTAQDAMQVARVLFAAPPAALPTLTQLPNRKLLALAPGGAELLQALVDDGSITDVAKMDRDAIRALIRERDETARLRERVDQVVAERDLARSEVAAATQLPPLPRRLQGLRLAALEEIEQIRAAALTLTRVLDDLESLPDDAPDIWVDAAAHPLLYGLQGIYAQVIGLLGRGYSLRPHYTAGDGLPPPVYTEQEAAKAAQWAERFLSDAERRLVRRQAQTTEIPATERRGPGRPKKAGGKGNGR